jgi:PAS domain S-box-containing protein
MSSKSAKTVLLTRQRDSVFMDIPIADFPIRKPRDASLASQRARLLGMLAGLSKGECQDLGKVVSATAKQVLHEVGSGTIRYGLGRRQGWQHVEVWVTWRGLSAAAVEDSLADLYSAGRSGTASNASKRRFVDFLEFSDDAGGEVTVKIGRRLHDESDRIRQADVAEWATMLATKSAQGALVSMHQQLRKLAEELASTQNRDTDLEFEARQVAAAQEMHQLLALVASKTDNSVIIMDDAGCVEWVNDGFTATTGYELAEVRGQRLDQILKGPQTDPKVLREIRQALQLRHGLNRELVRYRKTGRPYWELLSISPVIGESGAPARWVAIGTDVSTRREAIEALEQAKSSAEAASRAKSDFLANMSHEIRTPMNAIIGMTELALETDLTPEQREYMMTARDSAGSLMDLLNDILDLSKIEAGKLSIDSAPFDLSDVIQNTMMTFAHQAEQKGLKFTWHSQPSSPSRLVGDVTRVRQVLVNLVSNAIKFTERGEVVVDIEPQWQTGDEVSLHFSVRDTGIGISANSLKSIFDAFTQADGSVTRRFGGTGLGLTISARLVDLMGGRIWVQSEVSQGSAFHFVLPFRLASPGQLPRAAGAAVCPPGVALRALRVLVADDNHANRMLATRILEKRGHSVLAAADGLEAKSILDREPVDVALLDVQMPQLDGLSITREIRRREERVDTHLPIVAITAHAMKGDRERCLAAGVDAYLAKPLGAKQLYTLVESLGAGLSESIPHRTAPPQGPPCLGFCAALKRLEGDEELLREQMQFLLNEIPGLVEEVRTAIVQSDGRRLEVAAHRLKGLASGFDADEAVETAGRLEQLGRERNLQQALVLADQLACRLDRLSETVREYLAHAAEEDSTVG